MSTFLKQQYHFCILSFALCFSGEGIKPTLLYTAKPSVDFKSGLQNSRACVLSHCLTKEESPNLQLNSGSQPGAFCPLVNSLSIENRAILPGDSTHKLYCLKVHLKNQLQWQFGPPVLCQLRKKTKHLYITWRIKLEKLIGKETKKQQLFQLCRAQSASTPFSNPRGIFRALPTNIYKHGMVGVEQMWA